MHKHFVRGNTNELQLIRRMEDGIVKSNHSKGRRTKPRNSQALGGNDSDSINKASKQGCASLSMTSDCDSKMAAIREPLPFEYNVWPAYHACASIMMALSKRKSLPIDDDAPLDDFARHIDDTITLL